MSKAPRSDRPSFAPTQDLYVGIRNPAGGVKQAAHLRRTAALAVGLLDCDFDELVGSAPFLLLLLGRRLRRMVIRTSALNQAFKVSIRKPLIHVILSTSQ